MYALSALSEPRCKAPRGPWRNWVAETRKAIPLLPTASTNAHIVDVVEDEDQIKKR